LRFRALFPFPIKMKFLSYVCAAAAAAALGYWMAVFIHARIYQAHERVRFIEPGAETPRATTGSAIAILTIARLGVSAVVVEGAGKDELSLGPGHIHGTSLPGEGGNVGIAGHRDTSFRPLRFIHRGDMITITTHERAYQYKVVFTQIVGPEEIQVLRPLGHETLTLITCYPFHFMGAAPKRFVVRADCSDCASKASE